MAIRTHRCYAALADEQRLRVFLAVLAAGQIRQQELVAAVGIPQPAVSRAVTELRDVGLLARGNQRTPIYVPRPREARALVRAAALIEFAHTGNPEAEKLAGEIQRQDMALGADEPIRLPAAAPE
jgi:DNA-binding IclR family transcriptional regulator